MAHAPYLRLFTLAEGGMGTVDLCMRREGRFRRLYAVKRPYPHLLKDPSFADMFMDEGRLAGLLRHSHVVGVVDVGKDEQGPFLVMEYVDGLSVGEMIQATQRLGQILPLWVCLTIAAQAARGLHAAHELTADGVWLRLIHRDISPANILVGFDGIARVSDFGIAKAAGNAGHTTTGVLKGNPGYMSPEGLAFQDLDRRADLFALGVVLVEALSGERLYAGHDEGSAAARRILHDPPPDLLELRADAPPELVSLVMRLLAKDPAARPPTAAAVADQLTALLSDVALAQSLPDLAGFMTRVFDNQQKAHTGRINTAIADALSASSPRRRFSARVLSRRGLRRVVWIPGALALFAAGTWAFRHRPTPVSPGLVGSYFAGTDLNVLKVTRIDPQIDFDWTGREPAPGLTTSFFSTRWTGYLRASHTAFFKLCVVADDGIRLWLEDKLMIAEWRTRVVATDCVVVRLEGNRLTPIKIEYYQSNNQAVVRLTWEDLGGSGPPRPVPGSNLLHDKG